MLDRLDLVLVMTVNPGFGGQKFIAAMLDKIRQVRALVAGRPIRIQVDGGISVENAGLVAAAGADVLVAGSSIFEGGPKADYRARIAALRNAAARNMV